MAQDTSYLNREIWSNEMQKTFFVENTAVFLAGNDGAAALSADGRKYHKPIISHAKTGTYTPGNDVSDKEITSSVETLEVDTFKYASVYLDDTQKKQSHYSISEYMGSSMMKQLNNLIEQDFLSEVSNAAHTLDAGSVGGTAGNNIEFSSSNASKVFTSGHTLLDTVDAPKSGRVAVLGAHMVGVLRETKAGRESGLGDTVLANGVIGDWQGWTVVQNNNLPWSATLTIDSTGPTDGETLTIAGVVFEFQTTLSNTTAGYCGVKIDGSAATARANLEKAIEDSGTVDTHYTAMSDENRFIISEKRRITCTSAEAMAFSGFGDVVVSESASNVAWSAQKQVAWFGVRGATDMIVQMPTDLESVRVEKRFGDRIKALLGYGKKTFADGARCLIKCNVDASSWV